MKQPFVDVDGDILFGLVRQWQLKVGIGHVQLGEKLASKTISKSVIHSWEWVGLSDRGLIDGGLKIPTYPNGTITYWNRDNGGCPLGMLHGVYNVFLFHLTQSFFNLLSQKVRNSSGLQELGFSSFIHLKVTLTSFRQPMLPSKTASCLSSTSLILSCSSKFI